jgi:hypothetical protein
MESRTPNLSNPSQGHCPTVRVQPRVLQEVPNAENVSDTFMRHVLTVGDCVVRPADLVPPGESEWDDVSGVREASE